MKKYIQDYIKQMDEMLDKKPESIDIAIDEHLIKISFYQHERLIHLLVTLVYGSMMVISFAIASFEPMFVFIGIILLMFTVPYVLHYFYLENSVQYLYKQYDKLLAYKKEQ